MKILSIILALGLSISSAIGSVLLDFTDESSYQDHFIQATTTGTIGWKPNGYVQAGGNNVPVATRYTGETHITDSISMTFTVGEAQSGQIGIYTRIRADGGAVLGYVQIARSSLSTNGSYFELRLNYGGANMVLNGSTSTNFFTSSTEYLQRYLDPATDVFTLTLNQRQQGATAQFELALSVNGDVVATTGFQNLGVSSFNSEGGTALYFRPNTLNTVNVTSFAVVPEPSTTALLSLVGLGLLGVIRRRTASRHRA